MTWKHGNINGDYEDKSFYYHDKQDYVKTAPFVNDGIVAYVSQYKEGSGARGYIYKTPIDLNKLGFWNEFERQAIELGKNMIYVPHREESRATMPEKYLGLRFAHFFPLDESLSDTIPFLSKKQVILLSHMSTEYDEYDNFYKDYYYPEVENPHNVKVSTKMPNVFSIDFTVTSKEYYDKETHAGCGLFICNYLKATGLHPMAGSYIKEFNENPDSYYSRKLLKMRLVIGLNEKGKDYSHYYSKEFWEDECFNDDEVVIIKNNKMDAFI